MVANLLLAWVALSVVVTALLCTAMRVGRARSDAGQRVTRPHAVHSAARSRRAA